FGSPSTRLCNSVSASVCATSMSSDRWPVLRRRRTPRGAVAPACRDSQPGRQLLPDGGAPGRPGWNARPYPASAGLGRSKPLTKEPHVDSLGIDGAWTHAPRIYPDNRGNFHEWFRGTEFLEDVGYRFELAQANCSVSRRGVIRGIHFTQ